MVKELRRWVKENGLHSSFTMNLLHPIAEAHTVFPADWKSLFKTVLTGGQYSVWWTEFVDLDQSQALNNGNHQPPINITASQLSGADMFATVWAQSRLPLQVWDQCTVIAMRALQKVFDTKKLRVLCFCCEAGASGTIYYLY